MRKTFWLNILGTSTTAFALMHAVAWAQHIPDGIFEPLPAKVTAPKDNPTTPAKVKLGKQLFFDPRLSIDGTVSCNSCHNVMASGTDNRPNSVGVGGKTGDRGAPTVWNSGFITVQFWDGRAATLEDQAKGPLTNPIEMAMPNHDAVMKRVKAIPGYVTQFQSVFGAGDVVTIDNLAKAIAAFERTLITLNSPFDRYLRGNKKAISAEAVKGMKLVNEVGCTSCHFGPNFSGPTAPIGEGHFRKFPTFSENDYVTKYRLMEDKGRFKVTQSEEDKHIWRVQTWRNVALTAPYFHTGMVQTLDEAVRVMAKTQLDTVLTDEQVTSIVAFLNTLTGEFPKQDLPFLPETPGRTVLNIQ